MKPLFFSFFLCFFFHPLLAQSQHKLNQFDEDLQSLKGYFHLPGLSAVVKKGDRILFEEQYGYADLDKKIRVEAGTVFPVASLTKIFAAILILQLEEEGKLSLDDPMKKYFPKANIPETIKIKHVLSHTSQGTPGECFFYSSRYSYLTQVIEQAGGVSFSQLMREKILQPLGMDNTSFLASEEQAKKMGAQLAQPYTFYGETNPGRFEPGFSTSAGLMMTAGDLLLFDEALDNNLLLTKKSKKKMFTPFYEGAPYGLGIFTQQFMGFDLIWGYGQYDCYSSLYLKIPEKELTLILLANNKLMSDPARLIYGDVTYSLFAVSFLKNFVFDFPKEDSPFENIQMPGTLNDKLIFHHKNMDLRPLIRQQTLAWGLAKSFMGQVFAEEKKEGYSFLHYGLGLFEDYKNYGNLSLMHALLPHTGEPWVDEIFLAVGEQLLKECPENPYANLYFGEYYASQDEAERALVHFKTIADAKNFERFWYTSEALNFIREYFKERGQEVPERYKN